MPRRLANLSPLTLVEEAIRRQEGTLADNGAFLAVTGSRTGRSPNDRFIVKDELTANSVDWGSVNKPFDPETFTALANRVRAHLSERDVFTQEVHIGASAHHYIALEVTTEFAWHCMFASLIFIRPDSFNPAKKECWSLISAPTFVCDPDRDGTNSDGCVIINFSEKTVLIAGMRYAGEMKKSMFSVQNYLLPAHDVLPMHCSANIDKKGNTALFFGLSGTGKTTLSADPSCNLIGDDEHAWASGEVFNLEGGCYAKCVNLSEKHEPLIYSAIRTGAILENVVVDPETRHPDYDSTTITENTRCCYPRSHIEGCVPSNTGDEPTSVVFLTCDVGGVLPPVSILSPQAAAYHFLSGYTAKVGSTEVGSTVAIESTFSTCFGAPFFPRRPKEYADLLIKRLAASKADVFLVNTGWTGGPYGVGSRFPIPVTRAVVTAIQNGTAATAPRRKIEGLNVEIPTELPGVDSKMLDPREAWSDKAAYDAAKIALIKELQANFKRFDVPQAIVDAGPNS